MKILTDLHTHTTANTHAYSTVTENASFAECIPYLNRMLSDAFEGWYRIPEDAWLIEMNTGIRLSNAVTISHLNLEDGMRLMVY